MTRTRFFSRQHGMAVISALLVVSAAAIISASMLERQTNQMRTLESETARVQARAFLAGGIDWARVILRADARRSPTTRTDQIWATPITDLRISEEGDAQEAVFSGRVEDELSKFNLQNLARAGQVDESGVAALTRLMQSLNLDTSAAAAIAQRIAQSQSSKPTVATAGNAADSPQTQAPPATAPGVRTLGELRSVGLDPAAIQTLGPFVTILPTRTAVNVNTASPAVLAATLDGMSLGQASALLDQRDRGQYFNTSSDFQNRLANPDIVIADDALVTTSTWFTVHGTVNIAQAQVDMRALLRRNGDAIPEIIWMMETQ